MGADGQPIALTPTGGETSNRNSLLLIQLGLVLPRWGPGRGFPPLCPDLVVELASASDEGPRGLTALRADD